MFCKSQDADDGGDDYNDDEDNDFLNYSNLPLWLGSQASKR